MKNLQTPEIWYVTGSQHLYGEQTLRQVAANSQKIVEELNRQRKARSDCRKLADRTPWTLREVEAVLFMEGY